MKLLLVCVGVLLSLQACAKNPQTHDDAMLKICREFVQLKISVATQVDIDAIRPEGEQILELADLKAIDAARDGLDLYCPPPEGYSAISSTLELSNIYIRVLDAYSVGQGGE